MLKDIRALRGFEVVFIVSNTPRPFGRQVEVVQGEEAVSGHASLRRGMGLLCAIKGKVCTHVVSVFRCLDGRYLYYDPLNPQPHQAFYTFCRHNNITERQVTVVRAAFQQPGFRSCAYHALTFLDYVTRLREKDSWLTIASFRRYMGEHTDLKAICAVKVMLREFPNSINLSLSLTPGGERVYIPITLLPRG